MRRIAVINQKGGVGKTTTVANLGVALARMGQRVLLLDLDPQAHLSLHLGVEPSHVNLTIYQVLTEMLPIEQARIAVSDMLHLVPSHIDLAAAEMELASAVGRDLILRDQLAQLQGQYDILLMDCPPSLGLLTINALAAADEVFIPLQPHFLALQGLSKLLKTVSLVTQRLNSGLRVSGIMLCMYESNTRLAAEVVDSIKTFLDAGRGKTLPWSKAILFRTRIRRNIKLAESPSHGESIFEYGPKTAGAVDYHKLAREVMGLNEPEPQPEAADESATEPAGEPSEAPPALSEPAAPAAAATTPAPAGNNGDALGTAGQQSVSPPGAPVSGV
jgi:chromosome partitioning protein